ncbi:DUF4337 family protein [Sphingomonas sp.]|uniref:DUF4337 family protein n=1 Tax=Sphingomonas sp. TaxID=28214 RepID=UPI0037529F6D
MEASEAKDLIDEAIERTEAQHEHEQSAERVAERTFRDRVSVLIGIFAVCLAVIHMAAAGSARDSLLRGIEASDTFAYMQAKIVRETVLKTASASTADSIERAAWASEAKRLRQPDRAEHGIGQLQAKGEDLRREGKAAATAGEGYELGETALQMAIVLLSIALVARSRPITYAACALAILGIGLAIGAKAGFAVLGFA